MASDFPFRSASGDVRGDNALPFIPTIGDSPSEVMLHAAKVTRADAVTACAFRSLIEFHGRYRSVRVVLTPPEDAAVGRLLMGLLGSELPRHLCFANDVTPPSGSSPRTVALPATVIRSYEEADMIADALPGLGRGFSGREWRFLEGAYGELVENALAWGADSPIGAVVAAVHERHEHILQVAVTDLGATFSRIGDAQRELAARIGESIEEERGIALLAGHAGDRGLDMRLSLAAGTGRAFWADGEWRYETAQDVGGFTAVASIAL